MIKVLGKTCGNYNGRDYFGLYLGKTSDNVTGISPVLVQKFGKVSALSSCTKNVFDVINVDDEFDPDSFYYDQNGKILEVR